MFEGVNTPDVYRGRVLGKHDVAVDQSESSSLEGKRQFCPGFMLPVMEGEYEPATLLA